MLLCSEFIINESRYRSDEVCKSPKGGRVSPKVVQWNYFSHKQLSCSRMGWIERKSLGVHRFSGALAESEGLDLLWSGV